MATLAAHSCYHFIKTDRSPSIKLVWYRSPIVARKKMFQVYIALRICWDIQPIFYLQCFSICPDIYTEVQYYADWIKKRLED